MYLKSLEISEYTNEKLTGKVIKIRAALKCFLTPFEMFQIVNQSKLFLKTSKHVHNSDQDSGTENLSQTPKLRAAAPFGCL